MKINFFKMQAQGNDYIYIDLSKNKNAKLIKKNCQSISKKLSKRRFSIGSDGLVLIEKSPIANGKMTIINSDGSFGQICGNALRCVGSYLSNLTKKANISIETNCGVKRVYTKRGMTYACLDNAEVLDIDITKVYDKQLFNRLTGVIKTCFVTVGNPHFVIFCEKSKYEDNGLIAPLFNKTLQYFDSINVEVCYVYNNEVFARVFERGSGETLCCGSGSVAIYKALTFFNYIKDKKTAINFSGGKVYCEYNNKNIILSGYTKLIYKGVVNYD